MKRKDILLIIVFLCIALAGLAATRLLTHRDNTEAAQVVITLDGDVYGTYPLDEDQVIEIHQDLGYNKVVIAGGSVDVTDADCPDKICADHAVIHYDHETIICLPHKLVVEIQGGETSEIDVTTH